MIVEDSITVLYIIIIEIFKIFHYKGPFKKELMQGGGRVKPRC